MEHNGYVGMGISTNEFVAVRMCDSDLGKVEKSLSEMRLLAKSGLLAPLTIERAKELKGKTIHAFAYGYAGQDYVDVFTVGEVMSEVEYYRNLKEDCYPDKDGHRNRAEEWESVLSPAQMEEKRGRILLLRESGGMTGMVVGSDGQTFSMGDADRYVGYVDFLDSL